MNGFSKLSREERFARLKEMGVLTAEDVDLLASPRSLDPSLAEKFIENVIGYYQLPLGVATNLVIDGEPLAVPMAVEETSIIAALSKTAKWIREHGSITTELRGRNGIGQIQLAYVENIERFRAIIEENSDQLVEKANAEVAKGLVRRGGGVSGLKVRSVPRGDGSSMAVIHVMVDTCDAMGANIINQVCEFLKQPVEELTGEVVTMCILSNLTDTRLIHAKVVMKGLEPELMKRIEEASLFAQQDPYRAATNNKGVLNGIDPILIATGNDWRAVEAGIHAFAANSGIYRSVTKWRVQDEKLIGEFEAPISLGIVGGVTALHPTAKICLRMLKAKTAERLSRICAAVGLVQNLGALRALTTVGIIEGHMKLHIQNLTLGAGAKDKEIPIVQKRLEEILSLRKRISLSNAIEVLRELRSQSSSASLSSPASPDPH